MVFLSRKREPRAYARDVPWITMAWRWDPVARATKARKLLARFEVYSTRRRPDQPVRGCVPSRRGPRVSGARFRTTARVASGGYRRRWEKRHGAPRERNVVGAARRHR